MYSLQGSRNLEKRTPELMELLSARRRLSVGKIFFQISSIGVFQNNIVGVIIYITANELDNVGFGVGIPLEGLKSMDFAIVAFLCRFRGICFQCKGVYPRLDNRALR